MKNPFQKAMFWSLIVCILSVGFLLSLAACDESQIRKAATASDRMATLIVVGIDVKRDLRTAALIDADEDRAISQGLLSANKAVQRFNERARTYQTLTPTARSELTKLFADVTGALKTLNDDGIFRIRNPDAQKKLAAVLASLNEAAGFISQVLNYG